ncbi:MAG: D-2-hydroxyacid dehydrogenase family protein [Kiloniellales bacterium]
MKIAILDDYQDVARSCADWSAVEAQAEIAVFHDHLHDFDALAERLAPFEAIVIMRERTPFPAALFERLPNLELLVSTGHRNASVDVAAAKERGVVVCSTDSSGGTTAELTWGLILAVARKIPEEDRALREGRWQTTLGTGLLGKTLGVIGLGRIGSQMARVAKEFGMDVVAWSQNLTEERCREVGVRRAATKDALLAEADIVTIHVVLSDRSRGLIGARELGLMKPSAYLINSSRGPIVEEKALADALEAGRIAGAGIDVYDVEPLPADHPLRRAPRTVLTPHLGYVSDDNYRVFFTQVVENILAFMKGSPIRVVGAK